jgi:ParB family chromosome partitioning protein
MELADLVAKKNDTQAILAFATRPDHANLTSDQRFETLAGFLAAPPEKAVQEWQILEALPVRLKETPTGATFVFNSKAAPGFDQFVKQRLASLYTEYRQQTGD